MFKGFLIAALLASTAVFAQGTAPGAKEDTYVYEPKVEFVPIPSDQILVQPAPKDLGKGAAQWCDTLRGKGAVALSDGKTLIIIVIDCPEQHMKDI